MHLLAREEAGLRCLLQVALGAARDADPAPASQAGHGPTANVDTALPPVPIARIAAEEGLSNVYAAKLMRQLRLAGLVESTRGAAGGYRLARPPGEITVWDAIRALDESFLPETPCDCDPADRIDCRRTTSCAVTSLFRRLGDGIRRELEAVTLAELCRGSLERRDRVELPVVPDDEIPAPGVRERLSHSHESQERSPTWSLSS